MLDRERRNEVPCSNDEYCAKWPGRWGCSSPFGELQLAGSRPRELTPIYRLLGTLTDDQWERLHGAGLTWGVDLSPKATDEERSHGFWLDRQKGDVLRVVELNEEMLKAVHEQHGPVDARAVLVLRDGKPIAGDGLLLTAYVEPRSVESLERIS